MAAARANADGNLDLLTANETAGNVSIRVGNGAGGFGGTTNVAVGRRPRALAAADVDGDGDMDFVVGNTADATVSVRLNNGTGTFNAPPDVTVNGGAVELSLGDVDGDGDLDLLTSHNDNELSIRYNDGTGTFRGLSKLASSNGSFGSVLAEMNNDGRTDVVVGQSALSKIGVVLGGGDGNFIIQGAGLQNDTGAGGYFQTGNLGGTGVGGALGLLLAKHLPMPGAAGIILGVSCLACCLALFAFKDQTTTIRTERIGETYRALVADVWAIISTKSGGLALLLCFLPLGTGAASGLWSAIATDWQAGAGTVTLVTGVLGGLVSAVGCLAGGWICDRVSPRYAYLLFGLTAAACLVGMAYAPRVEAMFIAGTLAYALANGLCYAGFTALTLEAIGKGAAVTKYNLFASLSNSPAYLLTYILGFAYARLGAGGMLNTEAAFAVGAVAFFLLLQRVVYRNKIPHWRKQTTEPAEAALLTVPVSGYE